MDLFGCLRASWEPFGELFGSSWTVLERLGGPSGISLGPLEGLLEHPREPFGLSWGILGAIWATLRGVSAPKHSQKSAKGVPRSWTRHREGVANASRLPRPGIVISLSRYCCIAASIHLCILSGGSPGVLSGAFWAVLGRFWGPLGAFQKCLDCLGGVLGAY